MNLLAINIDFPFVWKAEQKPFSYINSFCMENHLTEYSILQNYVRTMFFILFTWTLWQISLLNWK